LIIPSPSMHASVRFSILPASCCSTGLPSAPTCTNCSGSMSHLSL
jgi:hypothetical protein